MRRLRIAYFDWIIAALWAVLGALILVTPDRFTIPSFSLSQPWLACLGVGFLLASAAPIAASTLAPRRTQIVVAHVFAAIPGFILAYAYSAAPLWLEEITYGVLALAIAFAPIVSSTAPDNPTDSRGDYFSLVIGLSAVLSGLTLIMFPDQFASPMYDAIRPALLSSGLAFLGCGLLICIVQLRPAAPRWLIWFGTLPLAAAFFFFVPAVVGPAGSWIGVLYYGGLGVALALSPWITRNVRQFDPTSIRTLFALTVVVNAAIPLIAAVALGSDLRDRSTRSAQLTHDQSEAATLASAVDNYVALHRAGLIALARQPEIVSMDPITQKTELQISTQSFSDVPAFATFDAAGRAIARSDSQPLTDAAGFPVFELARQSNASSLDILISPVFHRPVFSFGEPVRGANGQFIGLVTEALEPAGLATLLAKSNTGGERVFLVDNLGRAIAHPDSTLVARFADLSAEPAVADFLHQPAESGSLSFVASDGEWLAGRAEVPVLGWGVIYEVPAAEALASDRAAGDVGFGALFVFVSLAAIGGIIVSGWLTAPILVLARALARLSAGDDTAPLPETKMSEAAQLTADFTLLRDRLGYQTVQRILAESALQAANKSLAEQVEKLTERDRDLGLLNEVGGLLQTSVNRDELYDVMALGARRLFPIESGAVLVLRNSQNILETVAAWGERPTGEKRFGPEDCLALRRGRPYVVEDLASGLACPHVKADVTVPYMCIPMMAQGSAIGVLHVRFQPTEPGYEGLSMAREQLATTVAEQFALALANLRLQETLRNQAIRDPLTGLYNRRYLEESFQREISRATRRSRPVGVMMLDIDHFKAFNDTHGHQSGDKLLREVGMLLGRSLRQEDIACRYGGEEFTLILPDASLADTERRAQQITEQIRQLEVSAGSSSRTAITISCGIAAFPNHGSDVSTLISAADAALYVAKTTGRDRCVTAPAPALV